MGSGVSTNLKAVVPAGNGGTNLTDWWAVGVRGTILRGTR